MRQRRSSCSSPHDQPHARGQNEAPHHHAPRPNRACVKFSQVFQEPVQPCAQLFQKRIARRGRFQVAEVAAGQHLLHRLAFLGVIGSGGGRACRRALRLGNVLIQSRLGSLQKLLVVGLGGRSAPAAAPHWARYQSAHGRPGPRAQDRSSLYPAPWRKPPPRHSAQPGAGGTRPAKPRVHFSWVVVGSHHAKAGKVPTPAARAAASAAPASWFRAVKPDLLRPVNAQPRKPPCEAAGRGRGRREQW
jgi:hypothetical protein